MPGVRQLICAQGWKGKRGSAGNSMESAKAVVQPILAPDTKRKTKGAGMYGSGKGVGRVYLGYQSRGYGKEQYSVVKVA